MLGSVAAGIANTGILPQATAGDSSLRTTKPGDCLVGKGWLFVPRTQTTTAYLQFRPTVTGWETAMADSCDQKPRSGWRRRPAGLELQDTGPAPTARGQAPPELLWIWLTGLVLMLFPAGACMQHKSRVRWLSYAPAWAGMRPDLDTTPKL